MKKYKLTNETIKVGSQTLYRIKRISDGALGGFIESEKNLSHYGNAWVSGNAQVFGDTQVYGDAWVYGNAKVFGNAKVYGDAQVTEKILFLYLKKYNCTITDSIILWGCRQFMLWDLKQFEYEDCTEEWDQDVFETEKKIILEAAALKWGQDLEDV